ncbi:MAG: Mur ligase family protein, partial [Halanaerobiales bacterium]
MEKAIATLEKYTGITCDSRKVKEGYAFIAIQGFERDGNQYINEAIKNGASVIFTDQVVKNNGLNNNVPIIKVDNARTHLGKLAAEFYNHPSKKLELIGITGTNGKTTTTHLIYHLLNYSNMRNSGKNQKAGLIGTVQVDNGFSIIPGDLTTPDPVRLQKYLQEMLKANLKYACMEVSSHGIKLERISACNFSIKVATNITADHFDLHPNFEEYINVKKSFLEDTNDTLVLLNTDNKYIKSFGKIAKKQISFGINFNTDIRAEKIKDLNKGHSFIYSLNCKLEKKNKELINPFHFSISMNLAGYHNIYNALIAITIALYYNISIETIQDFFKNFKGIWRRLQFIYDDDFTIIDDCAHNPGSYQAVFEAVAKMKFNKLIVVNSLRGNRGTRINLENAITISKQ